MITLVGPPRARHDRPVRLCSPRREAPPVPTRPHPAATPGRERPCTNHNTPCTQQMYELGCRCGAIGIVSASPRPWEACQAAEAGQNRNERRGAKRRNHRCGGNGRCQP
jgi:hypothetical protein